MSSGRLGRRFGTVAAIAVACGCMLALQGGSVFGAEPEPAYIGAFGPGGTDATDFNSVSSVAVNQENGFVYVADREEQALYKFDENGQPVDFGGAAAYLDENRITGLSFTADNFKNQVAVDSNAGVIYLTSGNAVKAFAENGEPHEFPALVSSEISGATELAGVALDSKGNIYASDYAGEKIRIYSPSGSLLNEINFSNATNPRQLAVTPKGDLLMLEDFVAYRLVPSAYPVTSSTTYTREVEALDLTETFSIGVDPVMGFIYLGQRRNPEGISRVLVLEENGEFVGTLGEVGQEGEFQKDFILGIAIRPEKRAYFAVLKQGEASGTVEMFEPFMVFVGSPTIAGTSVTDLTSTSATLRARINPNTLPATYQFEYGLEDCQANPGVCTKVPVAPKSIGSGHEPVPVSQALSGLSPETTYFYRVVAENVGESGGVEPGPVRTFTTQGSTFDLELIDGRVWEQVTPTEKFGGGVNNGTLVQASGDGSAISFPTRGSIVENPNGSRALEPSAVVARHSGTTWQIKDLVPTYTKATGAGLGPEYKVFSSGLDRSILEPRDESPLSPEASERTPYLRVEGTPPVFRPIVTGKEGFANVEPPDTAFGGEINGAKNPVALEGANADLTSVVVSSLVPLLSDAPPEKPGSDVARALYHWNDGTLLPVSELPADEEGGKMVYGQVGSGLASVRHAVSDDGSRVFWNPAVPTGSKLDLDALYLREVPLGKTVRIDLPELDATGAGEAAPFFMGASADGSVVFFTDSQQLTIDANLSGRDLYRCEVAADGSGCLDLKNLTASTSGGEAARAQEIAAGISEDGETVYFVAMGALDAGPNDVGDTAQAEVPNLYRWQDGDGLEFIATLSENDGPTWGEAGDTAAGRMARSSAFSSPDGRYLTFMSEKNLAGDESDDPETGEPIEQIFLYDSSTKRLQCVSCNSGGGTNAGRRIVENVSEGGLLFPDLNQLWDGRLVGGTLPETTESEPVVGYSFYQPRALLDNGRVFFNSAAPLVPADSNGTWDVYQFEPFGIGNCGPLSGSASISRSGEGCVALISSGTDSNSSVFVDASESGDDLFFMTFAPLSVLDTDNIVDVYDARVGGVAAIADQTPEECLGEACQPKGPPPTDSPPASSTFKGAGNVKPKPAKHCRKGQRKVKRHGKVKCVKKKKKKKQHASSGAGK